MLAVRAAILCGGAGTRLWPVSNEAAPKQFHPLIGEHSLLSATVARALDFPHDRPPLIVTNAAFAAEARDHAAAGGAPDAVVLLEPSPRNTAPAAAFAAHAALADDENAILALLASDHHIANGPEFTRVIGEAATLAAEGRFVTLGIVPTSPNTGYGYIRAGAPHGAGFDVAQFVEKPDVATAIKFLTSGGYFWNAGIFIFRARDFLTELQTYRPDIAAAAEAAWTASRVSDAGRTADPVAWAKCPSESIDYAVAEKTTRAAMVPASIGWSDVGSWATLMELAPRDAQGNSLIGTARALDSKDCYVRASSRNVVVIGADNMIVVETPDAVLVVHKDKTQSVKQAPALFAPKAAAAE
jgi:mannose-1-phosphate guanylyltransferase/mannose-6-phosphate isomerase